MEEREEFRERICNLSLVFDSGRDKIVSHMLHRQSSDLDLGILLTCQRDEAH